VVLFIHPVHGLLFSQNNCTHEGERTAIMQKVTAYLKFQCPFGCLVAGPSMSGKSHFILQVLKSPTKYFDPPPARVIYVYSVWQDAFENATNITFVEGVKGLSTISFSKRVPTILVIDDLMEELCNDKTLSVLFTREMHHKNVTVFFLVQNLYKQGRCMRDVALNCQVMILFKSPRDTEQINVLARQTGIKILGKAYQEAIKERYGHLVINLQPSTPDILRLQSNLLGEHRRVYVPK